MKCSGIDAFTESWANERGWFSPPIYLVCRVLAKMSEYKVCGALVVPKWESASLWPLLLRVLFIFQHRKIFIRVVKAMIQCLGTLI